MFTKKKGVLLSREKTRLTATLVFFRRFPNSKTPAKPQSQGKLFPSRGLSLSPGVTRHLGTEECAVRFEELERLSNSLEKEEGTVY